MSDNQTRSSLRDFLQTHCLLNKQVKLASGEISDFYFDCRKCTLQAQSLIWCADLMLDYIKDNRDLTKVAWVAGPSIGADPLIAALCIRAEQQNLASTQGMMIRKLAKEHGLGKAIENQAPSKSRTIVVEDVVTSGGSIITACETLQQHDIEIAAIIAIIDREAGGINTLREKFPQAYIHALFNRSDFN